MAVGRINGLARLTGFSYNNMYGRFAGSKKPGRNHEVTVIGRGSTAKECSKKKILIKQHRSEAIFYRRHKILVSNTLEYAHTMLMSS